MTGRPMTLVLAGGGTGGHVIPAIAVAEEIARRGGRASFVGTADRLEARLVPAAGFPIDFISVRPLRGKGPAGAVRGALSVPRAAIASARLLRRIRPDAVLGVGGYVAGPVVLAAKLMRVPTAVLEQNATVGFSNRIVARFVDRAFVTYEETAGAFPAGAVEITGNPVKGSILAAARAPRPARGERLRLLVMGGSQGARTIDESVPGAVAGSGAGGRVEVVHQCGRGRCAEVLEAYRAGGIAARTVEFIDDTAAAYAAADLVIARAGATTVAELTAMGLPAVLVPYPHHADRQQEKNAAPMRRAGAAAVLDEKAPAFPGELAAAIRGLLLDPGRLEAAARASAALGRADAAGRIADGLERLAGAKP